MSVKDFMKSEDNGEKNKSPFNIEENSSVPVIFLDALATTKDYDYILEMANKKKIGLVVFVTILVALMSYVIPTAASIAGFGGIRNLFLNKLPHFEIQNGELVCDTEFMVDAGESTYMVRAGSDEINCDELEDGNVYVYFMKSKFSFFIYNEGQVYETMSASYSEVFADGFNNEYVANLAPYLYISLGIVFIMLLFEIVLKYLFVGVIFVLYILPLNAVSSKQLLFGDMLTLAFLCQLFGICLTALNNAFGQFFPQVIVSAVGVVITCVRISKYFKPFMGNLKED